jgi:urea transporter
VSQSFFFESASFGAGLLLLLFCFAPWISIWAGMAALLGYAYSVRSSTPKLLRDSGLIPLNGFFFGLSMASLYQPSAAFHVYFLLGALSIPLATKALFEVLQHWKLSPLILPYILAVWVVALCAHGSEIHVRPDAAFPHPHWGLVPRLLWALPQGAGRILFLADARFGLGLGLLILIFSPRRALFFTLGIAVATLAAFLVAPGGTDWEYGVLSSSAGLVGIGLSSFPERFGARNILTFCAVSMLLTLATRQFLRVSELPVLSLPYVCTLWLAILSRAPKFNVSWKWSA